MNAWLSSILFSFADCLNAVHLAGLNKNGRNFIMVDCAATSMGRVTALLPAKSSGVD
jgi:hypothetical protein